MDGEVQRVDIENVSTAPPAVASPKWPTPLPTVVPEPVVGDDRTWSSGVTSSAAA